MAFIKGKKVLLEVYKDGTYTSFMCATSCQIDINTRLKSVTTIGDGYWDKFKGEGKGYTVGLSGLIELTATSPVTFWLLENFDMQMLPVPFRMRFIDLVTGILKIITGSAFITRTTLTGVAQGFAGSTFEMTGHGAPVITNSATSCNATIGEITIFGEGDVTVGYEGVTNAARLEYSVDGGAREAIFDPGSNGGFFLVGLSEGSHTITIWAVCESGVDGEENNLIFEVDAGGEPGPTCSAPGVPAMSDITATSATAVWAAASPIPADGYSWILVETVGFTVVDSGTTSGLTTDLTDLNDGVTYSFRVKSLCETGVSESSYQSVEFTAEAPAICNVPGAPVMSAVTDTTATATWTAPSPLPGDGYEWEVLNGLTIIDSGSTVGLSVNLSGLPAGTLLTFKVKSICETGVSESGFNSETFGTDDALSVINWELDEGPGNGTLVIDVDGVEIVNETATGDGTFNAQSGSLVEITLTHGATGTIIVYDVTASVEIVNETDIGTTMASFSPTLSHMYEITATIS